MNKLDRLLKSYTQHIEIPWRPDVAAAQRVVFCVYDEADELHFRTKIDEFELATRQKGHDWACFDLTDIFSNWMSKEDYAASFFAEPELLQDLLPDELLDFIERRFDEWAAQVPLTEATVVALKDPASRKLLNEGVANVNDHNEEVLRFELETFVCDGQYQKGLGNILNTFLDNIRRGAPQQPGVWVSGFYGSGKSHLVKMLQTLWCNVEFKDGATPLGVSTLPQSIQDLFKELSVEAKRHGGLHAASGTLKANDDSNSVRSALLAIIFKSVGLPAKYHLASFVMWLAEEGLLDLLREQVAKSGRTWEKEVQRLHVSEVIRQGLVKLRPQLFFDEKTCADTLRNQFPSGKDVSNDEMVQAIRQALTKDEKFPLTLIILDEVQQYIGTSAERSIDVQEAVEACSKMIGGKLMFIGTGQTAVTGTSNLKKLEGRFTQRIELSDTDVEAVIRKVILAKKPEVIKPVAEVMEQNLGEISRHLSGSALAHCQDDIAHFPQDYPILPVRRRFWDNILRVLDQTGTDSQLRNQLTMIHKAIQSNLDQQLAQSVDETQVAELKEKLDELSAPFSDNVAFHAFLEMERMAAGLGRSKKQESE